MNLGSALGLASVGYAGYKQGEQNLQGQDYLQQQRADQEAQMAARQQTYQPAADAQNAQYGLSQATAQGQTSLVPQQTQLASTNLDTQQSAATAGLNRQPTVNQTADNQATAQKGFSSAQVDMLPTTLADYKAKGYIDDQTMHVASLNGLYNSMLAGPASAKQYVQNMANAGVYPNFTGHQIGQVGLTPDGQNFVIQDTGGNVLSQVPVSSIQQAHSMAIPTEWHAVGDTLMGTQGGRITQQQSAPQFKALRPGETGVVTQGNNITNSTQAPVPDAFANQHDSALVKNAKWISANVTGGDNTKALALAQQANSMSKAQFISTALPNMMTMGNMKPADAVNNLSQAYDMIRAQGTPGLSNAPASNTSGSSTIDSLIGGPSTTNPASTIDNPFQPDQ